MRIVSVAAAAVDAGVSGPERLDGVKGKRLHPVLKEQQHVREYTVKFFEKFFRFELMVMKRVRPGVTARLGVVGFIWRRHDELALRRKYARASRNQGAIV